jgi:hypothetical protein
LLLSLILSAGLTGAPGNVVAAGYAIGHGSGGSRG